MVHPRHRSAVRRIPPQIEKGYAGTIHSSPPHSTAREQQPSGPGPRTFGRRRFRAWVFLIVFTTLLAACSVPESIAESARPTTTTTERATPRTDEKAPSPQPGATPPLSPQEAYQTVSGLPGQLAIGAGPAVSVARPDGGSLTELDGPGSTGDGVTSQPVWSTEGMELAWFRRDRSENQIKVQSFDSEGLPTEDPLVSPTSQRSVFYLEWSHDDERLLSLGPSESSDFDIEMGVLSPGQPLEPVANGGPFFLSWAPGSKRILAHVDDSLLWLYDDGRAPSPAPGESDDDDSEVEDELDALEGPDVPAGLDRGTVLGESNGQYSAPAWIDEERAITVESGFLSVAEVADGTPTTNLVAVAEPLRFVLSPDRTRVAYQGYGPTAGSMTVGLSQAEPNQRGLLVFDLQTNEIELVSGDGALAWEWSPDSKSLAWLAPTGGNQYRWNFWSDSQELGTTTGEVFAATEKTLNVYWPFFAQYTNSITGWSPDSSAFAYSARFGTDDRIMIQLVEEQADAIAVAYGDFVTWGSGPTPPSSSGGLSPA